MKFVDLTGRSFGKWRVIRQVSSNKPGAHWECVCECGTKKVIKSGDLNNTKQCASCRSKKVARYLPTNKKRIGKNYRTVLDDIDEDIL